MAFQINVGDEDEAKIQDYLTFFSIAGTPQEFTESWINGIVTYDYDARQIPILTNEIRKIVPAYSPAGKTYQEVQADLVKAQELVPPAE